jgi:hypothetical protein
MMRQTLEATDHLFRVVRLTVQVPRTADGGGGEDANRRGNVGMEINNETDGHYTEH